MVSKSYRRWRQIHWAGGVIVTRPGIKARPASFAVETSKLVQHLYCQEIQRFQRFLTTNVLSSDNKLKKLLIVVRKPLIVPARNVETHYDRAQCRGRAIHIGRGYECIVLTETNRLLQEATFRDPFRLNPDSSMNKF